MSYPLMKKQLIKSRSIFLIFFMSFFSSFLFASEDAQSRSGMETNHESIELTEILLNGKYILLSDHTAWKVADAYIPIVKNWTPPISISIEPNVNESFPFVMKNLKTQTIIEVKKSSFLEIYEELEKEKEKHKEN